MDLQKAFGTSEKLEQEGRWFDFDDTSKFLIARTGNPRYRDMLRAKMKPMRQSLRQGLLDENPELIDPVLIEVISKTILLGWEGITHAGDPLPYSQSAAKDMLTKYKDFRDWVAKNADDMQNYKEESAAANRGNSEVA